MPFLQALQVPDFLLLDPGSPYNRVRMSVDYNATSWAVTIHFYASRVTASNQDHLPVSKSHGAYCCPWMFLVPSRLREMAPSVQLVILAHGCG
jgi:hypothetical protein